MTCVIVLQWKCQIAISKWRKVKTWTTLSTFLRFFDMTLQKTFKKIAFLDFEKKRKKCILELYVGLTDLDYDGVVRRPVWVGEQKRFLVCQNSGHRVDFEVLAGIWPHVHHDIIIVTHRNTAASTYTNHILHSFLPPLSTASQSYSLRRRTHSYQLPGHSTYLSDCSQLPHPHVVQKLLLGIIFPFTVLCVHVHARWMFPRDSLA